LEGDSFENATLFTCVVVDCTIKLIIPLQDKKHFGGLENILANTIDSGT
jgi:hypothetical protein